MTVHQLNEWSPQVGAIHRLSATCNVDKPLTGSVLHHDSE
jgi:hypothetical protein